MSGPRKQGVSESGGQLQAAPCNRQFEGAQNDKRAIAASTVLTAPTAMMAAVAIRSLLIVTPPLLKRGTLKHAYLNGKKW